MKTLRSRAVRVWEVLILLVFVAMMASHFRPGGSIEGVPEGIYVYSSGFTVGTLELKDGRHELRFNNCTHRDQLISKGAYWREADTLFLQDGFGGTRRMDILPDGFVNHNSDGLSEEYIQHVRGDGSRVDSPRMPVH